MKRSEASGVEEEARRVEDGCATPATRTLELDDDVGATLEADVVDAVLETDEGRAVARRKQVRLLDRAQHVVGGQPEEIVGHGASA